MTTATPEAGGDGMRTSDVILSVIVLFVLAVAQPLLDLLGRNAEFFLARSAPALDIVILAVILAVVLPGLIALAVAGVYRLHEPTGRILHVAILTLLGAVLALQIIELTPLSKLQPWIEIALAGATGVGVSFAFYRVEGVRSAGRFASIAPIVVLGLFLFTSSASQLIFAAPAIAQPAAIPVENPAPVVMVVFDEFPAASLMDAEGNVQENVYPNFGRLARDGTWYNNAVTVQQQTEDSLPAIVSGKNPPGDKIPTAGDHPFTLFTVLAEAYDLHVYEAVTDLCPEYACANETRPREAAGQRWGTLVDDLKIVAGHLFLPSGLTSALPPIDASWSNFSRDSGEDFDIIQRFNDVTGGDGRLKPVAEFLDDIEPESGEPSLHFLHALLPHIPWEFLPTGQGFESSTFSPGNVSPGWSGDEWHVSQAHQRHLMQVEYVDTIVGNLIDRLERADLYDEALIVIVADHGIAVRPSIEHRRVVTDDTVGDVAAVPLFIKQPHQVEGGTDSYRAETIDILPTIADILGIDLPWAVDGVSLVADDRPERTSSTTKGSKGSIEYGVDGSEAMAIVARKIRQFGSNGAFGLVPPGHADLLGLDLVGIEASDLAGFSASYSESGKYGDVDPNAPSVPSWLTGVVRTPEGAYEHRIIAVAVNGTISAVTRTHETDNGLTAFGAMIPPSAFVEGVNDIQLLLIEGTGAEREFFDLTR